jgi:hypothetical protein
VIDYIAAFDLAAVCRYRDGRLGVTHNPQGAASAWWVASAEVGSVLKAAKRNGGDIGAAARSLSVEIVDNATVVQRAKAAVGRIEAGMARAQRTGALSEFNRQYRQRRLEAAADGRPFMTYAQDRARLRQVLGRVAAGEPVAILREVFDPR